jgi:hypothetical protein
MKITIYLLLTDDDNGTNAQSFASEAGRDEAFWKWMSEQDGRTVDEMKACYGNDMADAYENSPRDDINSASWYCQELEIPDVFSGDDLASAVAEASDKAVRRCEAKAGKQLAAIEAFNNEFAADMESDDPINGSDAVDSVCRIYPLFKEAMTEDSPADQQRSTIAIFMEGGIIQSILTDKEIQSTNYVVIDYDTEGGDESLMMKIPQDGGGNALAYVSLPLAEVSHNWLPRALAAIKEQEG